MVSRGRYPRLPSPPMLKLLALLLFWPALLWAHLCSMCRQRNHRPPSMGSLMVWFVLLYWCQLKKNTFGTILNYSFCAASQSRAEWCRGMVFMYCNGGYGSVAPGTELRRGQGINAIGEKSSMNAHYTVLILEGLSLLQVQPTVIFCSLVLWDCVG